MEPVVLINPFEVADGREEECLARWKATAAYMRRQEGFVSTKLHTSLDPQARFRFVNVAVWRSPEHFQRAVSTPEFQALVRQTPFPHYPAVYQVAAE